MGGVMSFESISCDWSEPGPYRSFCTCKLCPLQLGLVTFLCCPSNLSLFRHPWRSLYLCLKSQHTIVKILVATSRSSQFFVYYHSFSNLSTASFFQIYFASARFQWSNDPQLLLRNKNQLQVKGKNSNLSYAAQLVF